MRKYLVCCEDRFVGRNNAYIPEETRESYFISFVHNYGFNCVEAAQCIADGLKQKGYDTAVLPAEI